MANPLLNSSTVQTYQFWFLVPTHSFSKATINFPPETYFDDEDQDVVHGAHALAAARAALAAGGQFCTAGNSFYRFYFLYNASFKYIHSNFTLQPLLLTPKQAQLLPLPARLHLP